MKALIVDDNKIARETLKHLIKQIKTIELVAECENALEAYNLLQNKTVDVLFLDIEMPEMSGLELTRNLGIKAPIIVFTTSKKEYALEAFELNVADYITKPIAPARFLQAIEKVKELLESKQTDIKIEDQDFIFIRDSNIVRRLNITNILYAEAMGDYVKLHTKEKFYAIHTTLKNVEERLAANNFLRVHRSYLISIHKIDAIQEGFIMINNQSIPVAESYKAILNKRMNIL
jgi:DNA-binding LytR/AlgR family response regulator